MDDSVESIINFVSNSNDNTACGERSETCDLLNLNSPPPTEGNNRLPTDSNVSFLQSLIDQKSESVKGGAANLLDLSSPSADILDLNFNASPATNNHARQNNQQQPSSAPQDPFSSLVCLNTF